MRVAISDITDITGTLDQHSLCGVLRRAHVGCTHDMPYTHDTPYAICAAWATGSHRTHRGGSAMHSHQKLSHRCNPHSQEAWQACPPSHASRDIPFSIAQEPSPGAHSLCTVTSREQCGVCVIPHVCRVHAVPSWCTVSCRGSLAWCMSGLQRQHTVPKLRGDLCRAAEVLVSAHECR